MFGCIKRALIGCYNVNNENGTGKYAVQKLCLFVYAIAISAYSNLKRLEWNPSMIRLRLQAIKVITASSAHFVTWRERLLDWEMWWWVMKKKWTKHITWNFPKSLFLFSNETPPTKASQREHFLSHKHSCQRLRSLTKLTMFVITLL